MRRIMKFLWEKCKACKDVDENLESCSPNLVRGKCKEGMVWEVSQRKCKKITRYDYATCAAIRLLLVPTS